MSTNEFVAASGPIQIIELSVGGMTCDDCVRTVTHGLELVAGVASADVSLERRSARVGLAEPIEPELLTAAVRASGYNAFVRSQAGDG